MDAPSGENAGPPSLRRGSFRIGVAFRPPTRCVWMSQLSLTRTAKATEVPSGDSDGAVSSPASSVSRVNVSKRSAGAGTALRGHQLAPAMITATAAINHGRRLVGGPTAACGACTAGAPMVDPELVPDVVVSVSSANA